MSDDAPFGIVSEEELEDEHPQVRDRVCDEHGVVKVKNAFGTLVCPVCIYDYLNEEEGE